MTFCRAACATPGNECHKKFTDEVSEAAHRWWNRDRDTDEQAPICVGDLSATCPKYLPVVDSDS